MAEFRDVTIVKKANIYFNGGVTSRTVIFKDGSKKTLGIMLPGEYEFNTGEREVMEILSGELDLLLPGHSYGSRSRVENRSRFRQTPNLP